jgi:hypothetical protein
MFRLPPEETEHRGLIPLPAHRPVSGRILSFRASDGAFGRIV